jgi:hypothetical protein
MPIDDRNLSEAEEKAIELIMHACDLVGWTVAIPDGETVPYLIIGNESSVEEILNKINGRAKEDLN